MLNAYYGDWFCDDLVLYGAYCEVFVLVGFEFFGLVLLLMWISRVPTVYLVLVWLILVFFGLVLFFVEDVRCAEGIPGNIGWNYCDVYWVRLYFTAPITDWFPGSCPSFGGACVDFWEKRIRSTMLMVVKLILGTYTKTFFVFRFPWYRGMLYLLDWFAGWSNDSVALGCYPCILVLGAGNNNGHYCVETCRPYFTQLMTVRREGESVDSG